MGAGIGSRRYLVQVSKTGRRLASFGLRVNTSARRTSFNPKLPCLNTEQCLFSVADDETVRNMHTLVSGIAMPSTGELHVRFANSGLPSSYFRDLSIDPFRYHGHVDGQ